jgi:pantoate--beta-alanine ligase
MSDPTPPPAAAADGQVDVIRTPAAMSAWSDAARARGQRIAFVPTMGYLHRGHQALVEEARRRADRVVISIFVNPTQFGPSEDLARYPRDLPGDLAKATSAGAEVAFVPEAAAMYPPGFQTFVQVRDLEQGLCGERRPGHFVGVATVVLKLLHIVRPHLSVFGEKDFQQLAVIRRMVADLALPVEIVSFPTVREPDGLALSSRNVYLSAADRQRATALSRGLAAARTRRAAGETDGAALLSTAREVIAPNVDQLDYLELRDAETLVPLAAADRPAVMLVAAFLGKTRLIDNIRL